MYSREKAAAELTCAGTVCSEDQAGLPQPCANVFVDCPLAVTITNTAAWPAGEQSILLDLQCQAWASFSSTAVFKVF